MHYKWEEFTMDRHYKWEECTGDRHYKLQVRIIRPWVDELTLEKKLTCLELFPKISTEFM